MLKTELINEFNKVARGKNQYTKISLISFYILTMNSLKRKSRKQFQEGLQDGGIEGTLQGSPPPTKTSKIHLHVEQFSQKSN